MAFFNKGIYINKNTRHNVWFVDKFSFFLSFFVSGSCEVYGLG